MERQRRRANEGTFVFPSSPPLSFPLCLLSLLLSLSRSLACSLARSLWLWLWLWCCRRRRAPSTMPSVLSKYKLGIASSLGAASIIAIIAYIRRQQDVIEVSTPSALSRSLSLIRSFTHSTRYGVTVVVGWFQEPEEGPVPCRNARQQGEDRRRRRVHAASASYSADPRAQRLLARYAVEHYLTTSQPLPLQPLSEIVHHLAQRTRQRKKRSTVC